MGLGAWDDPDVEPPARVIYGPRGEKLRVWKETGVREPGFKPTDNKEHYH